MLAIVDARMEVSYERTIGVIDDKPNVAAEAGVGRDEANRISTRVNGKLSKPC